MNRTTGQNENAYDSTLSELVSNVILSTASKKVKLDSNDRLLPFMYEGRMWLVSIVWYGMVWYGMVLTFLFKVDINLSNSIDIIFIIPLLIAAHYLSCLL